MYDWTRLWLGRCRAAVGIAKIPRPRLQDEQEEKIKAQKVPPATDLAEKPDSLDNAAFAI